MKEKKQQNLRYLKYIVPLSFILLTIGIFCFNIFFKQDNDSIYEINRNNILFKNVNPNFEVDFLTEDSSSSIRFSAKGSNVNPFEDNSLTTLDKVSETLNIKNEKKGIKFGLKGISYNETMREILNDRKGIELTSDQEIDADKFELVEQGRSIGSDSNEAVSKQTIVQKDISQGIDIEYQIISGKGVKEEIVLKELPIYIEGCDDNQTCNIPANVFYFDLELEEGLNLNYSIESQTYYFTDNEGKYYAHFLQEYAKDNLGNKTTQVDVVIEEVESSIYLVTVTLDPYWLLSSEREFPIRIDPSVVHDTAGVLDIGIYEGTQLANGTQIQLSGGSSGSYTSGSIDMGENSRLKDIDVKAFGSDTGNGEIPFSTMGLVTQWNFNEVDGIKARNMSECDSACDLNLNSFVNTSGQDVKDMSGWSKAYSKWGNGSLMFDGIDDYISGSIPSISSKDTYSIELWVLPLKSDLESSYVFSSNLGSLLIEDGYWKVTNGTEIFDSKIAVEYYRWQHLTLILSTEESNTIIYSDGSGSQIENFTTIPQNSNNIYIGGYPSRSFFKGVVDVTRVYDRALTESEIHSNSQISHIGMEYRTSNDGNTWSEWSNQQRDELVVVSESIDITSEENSSLVEFEPNTTQGNTVSFLVAGDSKAGSLEVKSHVANDVVFDSSKPIASVGLWIRPQEDLNNCLIGDGEYSISFEDDSLVFKKDSINIKSNLKYLPNEWNYISLVLSESNLNLFVNGFLSNTEEVGEVVLSEDTGISGCILEDNRELIKDIEYSNTPLEPTYISEKYLSQVHAQRVEITFQADLQGSDGIANSEDTEFSISELPYGAERMIENLNIGDSIVIKENEYIAQGTVISLNDVTGKILVSQWKSESTFPPEGFSVNSKIFKWQRIYLRAGGNNSSVTEDLRGLFFVKTLENSTEYLLKDFEVISPYRIDENMSFESITSRYLQYKLIMMTTNQSLSPYVTQVNIEYDVLGPSMEKVMRHGQWFDSGKKQPYWWAD